MASEAKMLAICREPSTSPIANLAVELLSYIFVLTGYKAPHELAILEQVCRHWREVAINTAELWTRIPCERNRHHLRNLYLERSTTRPLDVAVILRSEKVQPIDDYCPVHVLEHLARIERLRVDFLRDRWMTVYYNSPYVHIPHDPDEERPKYHTFAALCRRVAPKLRVLELCRREKEAHPKWTEWIRSMFWDAELYHLKLEGICIPYDSHLLSSRLTYLHINTNAFFRPHNKFTPQETRSLLARLNRLEYLHLEEVISVEERRDEAERRYLRKVEPVHLPSGLKTLVIKEKWWFEREFCSFFEGITFPGTLDLLSVGATNARHSLSSLMTTIKEACRDWEEFWSSDIWELHAGTHTPDVDCWIRGITKEGADKLQVELPNCIPISGLCSVLYTSGAPRIRSVEWGIDAEGDIHQAMLDNTEPLERVVVAYEVLGEFGGCLLDPALQDKVLNLQEIVVDGLNIWTPEDECYRLWNFEVFVEALGSRRDAGQSVPRVSLIECYRVPRWAYAKLCGIVGEVVKEYSEEYIKELIRRGIQDDEVPQMQSNDGPGAV